MYSIKRKLLFFSLALIFFLQSCQKEAEKETSLVDINQASGTIYIGGDISSSSNCKMYAVDARTGNIKWEKGLFSFEGPTSTATFANGKLYFAIYDGIASIDTATKKYEIEIDKHASGGVHNTPLLYKNAIYYTTGGTVYGKDLGTGNIILSTNLVGGGSSRSACTISDGILHTTGSLAAIDISNGNLLWNSLLNTGISGPTVNGDMVYHGMSVGLTAFDVKTGAEKWSFINGEWVNTSPTFSNGIVYFGSSDNFFYAFDAVTGKQVWKKQIGVEVVSSPIVKNQTVYFASADNIHALDAKTGDEKWNVRLPLVFDCSPVFANGIIYLVSQAGKMYAINSETGEIFWEVYLGGVGFGLTSPIVVDKDGVVYHPGVSGEQN